MAQGSIIDREGKRERVAQLLSLGTLPVVDIAKKVGVSTITVYNWAKDPDIKLRVKQIRDIDFEYFRMDRELLLTKLFESYEVAKAKKDIAGMQTAIMQAAKLGGYINDDLNVNHKHSISSKYGTTDDWSEKYVAYDEKPVKVIEAKLVEPTVEPVKAKKVPPWRK